MSHLLPDIPGTSPNTSEGSKSNSLDFDYGFEVRSSATNRRESRNPSCLIFCQTFLVHHQIHPKGQNPTVWILTMDLKCGALRQTGGSPEIHHVSSSARHSWYITKYIRRVKIQQFGF